MLVLLIGGVVAASAFTGQSTDGTAHHAGVRRLIVQNPGGRITVRAGGPQVTVRHHLEWAMTRPWLVERRDGPALTLLAACTPPTGVYVSVDCSVRYDIEVPPDIDVDLTASGPIAVTGVRGQVTVQSG
ncbi:hypothetical protein [Jidongwangia harbinensis]|uniref:hypothetical protein n=1 Tax=Jidongwangia harbinensis TaxID=2878561 RepID=UPI001CD9860F|nr:hypothetical protein [Jidongwangia harbinensis]MCA2213100.1 hypothetical protein [Jidongwangia harbinensis]